MRQLCRRGADALLVATVSMAALLLPSVRADAQSSARTISGVVRDSATGQPLAGAVVLVLTASDSTLARTLTNRDGQYRVPRPLDAQHVELRHIGFRPGMLALPQNDSAADTIDIALMPLPTLMEPAMIQAAARCPRRADAAVALGLWEQARSALLAAVVSRETAPPNIVRLRFDRTLDGDRAMQQVVFIDSASTAEPFPAARSGLQFAVTGFFQTGEDGRSTFFAPDADVLLEESFARNYCFRIAPPDRRRPNEAGLALSPIEKRAGRVDIDGVLWIDTVHRELRDMRFEYVSRDAALAQTRRGGRIEFQTLANGALFDRWTLQLPRIRVDDDRVAGRAIVRTTLEPHEVGGEVARAHWPDGFDWHTPLGTLQLRVQSTRAAVDRIRLRLRETNYEAVTDASGVAKIADLLPGPYEVDVLDSALARIDLTIPTSLKVEAFPDSVAVATLDLPTRADFVAGECRRDRQRVEGSPDSAAWLVVRVVASDGRSVDGVRASLARSVDREFQETAKGGTGPNGLFYRCAGLERGEPTELRVWRKDKPNAPVITRFVPKEAVTVLRIDVSRP